MFPTTRSPHRPDPSAIPDGPAPRCSEIHLAMMAPSFVNPLEHNVVINPAHPDFDQVLPGTLRPFVFDRRLAHP